MRLTHWHTSACVPQTDQKKAPDKHVTRTCEMWHIYRALVTHIKVTSLFEKDPVFKKEAAQKKKSPNDWCILLCCVRHLHAVAISTHKKGKQHKRRVIGWHDDKTKSKSKKLLGPIMSVWSNVHWSLYLHTDLTCRWVTFPQMHVMKESKMCFSKNQPPDIPPICISAENQHLVFLSTNEPYLTKTLP